DPRGPWKAGDLLRKDVQKSGVYEIITPSGRKCFPPAGRSWRVPEYMFLEMVEDNRIWFGYDGNNILSINRFLSEVKEGVVSNRSRVIDQEGDIHELAEEVKVFLQMRPLATTKPERLIASIFVLGTNSGGLGLDRF